MIQKLSGKSRFPLTPMHFSWRHKFWSDRGVIIERHARNLLQYPLRRATANPLVKLVVNNNTELLLLFRIDHLIRTSFLLPGMVCDVQTAFSKWVESRLMTLFSLLLFTCGICSAVHPYNWSATCLHCVISPRSDMRYQFWKSGNHGWRFSVWWRDRRFGWRSFTGSYVMFCDVTRCADFDTYFVLCDVNLTICDFFRLISIKRKSGKPTERVL